MDNSIIRVEENGVEYFTLVATGESGLTGRGIAKSLKIANSTFAYNVSRVKKQCPVKTSQNR